MKNSKKGISLIVLVITIVVIIILAAAVILTLNNNNPITQANEAVKKSDQSEYQSAVTLYLAKVLAENGGIIPAAKQLPAELMGANETATKALVVGADKIWGTANSILGLEAPSHTKYSKLTYNSSNGTVVLTSK